MHDTIKWYSPLRPALNLASWQFLDRYGLAVPYWEWCRILPLDKSKSPQWRFTVRWRRKDWDPVPLSSEVTLQLYPSNLHPIHILRSRSHKGKGSQHLAVFKIAANINKLQTTMQWHLNSVLFEQIETQKIKNCRYSWADYKTKFGLVIQ